MLYDECWGGNWSGVGDGEDGILRGTGLALMHETDTARTRLDTLRDRDHRGDDDVAEDQFRSSSGRRGRAIIDQLGPDAYASPSQLRVDIGCHQARWRKSVGAMLGAAAGCPEEDKPAGTAAQGG
ncbi:hypothetical protein MAPG_03432 [Magnaporthiopsis poae ATCC 64411]|uniref:Uncharacterized protein n=1 Tax=Magnaporthiopsis poae (strain ATCC 64411 / 73-15) TaxID=644358 RepID=A0A0C4DU01_MAGP6|nr:hypothetical protein MAPG_03432 [Magnaporthiopsis poae ATCC 64411]